GHLSLRFDVTGRLEDRNFPNRSAGDIFRALMRGKPNLPAYWPNGLPGPDIEFGNNPVVIATPATGYDKDQRDYVQGTLGVDFKVPGISGLTLRGNAAYDNLFRSEKQWRTPWTLYTWANQARDANGQPILLAASRGYSTPELNQNDRRGTSILLNLVAEYRRNVGPHTVGILGGVERQTADSEYVSAFRKNYVTDQIDQINAGGDAEKNNSGSAFVAARQNYFTRLNYAFQDKYLLGVNQAVNSIFRTRTPSPTVAWEAAKQLDVGIEARLLHSRLSFEFDRFTERRSNILWLRNASVPRTAGLSLPRENIGEVAN